MRIKVYLYIFLVCFLILSCSTTKHSECNLFAAEIDMAVKNSQYRDLENMKQFEELIRTENIINEFSEEVIKELNENGYVEADINRLYGVEIEKIYVQNLLKRRFELFETHPQIVVINNIKYKLNYLIENDLNYPNIYTEVYFYDSIQKNIRAFYKVNYKLEYYLITVEDCSYKIFF